jgi:hypothetical protein
MIPSAMGLFLVCGLPFNYSFGNIHPACCSNDNFRLAGDSPAILKSSGRQKSRWVRLRFSANNVSDRGERARALRIPALSESPSNAVIPSAVPASGR